MLQEETKKQKEKKKESERERESSSLRRKGDAGFLTLYVRTPFLYPFPCIYMHPMRACLPSFFRLPHMQFAKHFHRSHCH